MQHPGFYGRANPAIRGDRLGPTALRHYRRLALWIGVGFPAVAIAALATTLIVQPEDPRWYLAGTGLCLAVVSGGIALEFRPKKHAAAVHQGMSPKDASLLIFAAVIPVDQATSYRFEPWNFVADGILWAQAILNTVLAWLLTRRAERLASVLSAL